LAAERLTAALGFPGADTELFAEALTHASRARRRGARAAGHNERLEFLGDRVLGLLAAEALIHRFPHDDEGDLAPRLNALVRKETCATVARAMDLGPHLVMSGAEEGAGGRDKPAILADACEAVMGALYLDSGLDAARELFERFWGPMLDAVEDVPRDAKTRLQEWAHQRTGGTPHYAVLNRSGPDHAPRFEVEVRLKGFESAPGEGDSKRGAEQAAAAAFLRREGVMGEQA
jgi:ribonuclease-3